MRYNLLARHKSEEIELHDIEIIPSVGDLIGHPNFETRKYRVAEREFYFNPQITQPAGTVATDHECTVTLILEDT